MTSNYYQKHKEKKHAEDIKIFLKKEKKKKHQCHCECNKNLSEEQKQRLVKYMRNYYSPHKK